MVYNNRITITGFFLFEESTTCPVNTLLHTAEQEVFIITTYYYQSLGTLVLET